MNRLTTRLVSAGTVSRIGSLTASAPGLIVTAACPANVIGRLVPAATAAPPAETPMSSWLKVTGRVPKTFDRRIRTDRPPALAQTTSLMVWSLNPAADRSPAEASGDGVAAMGLAAQVDTQWLGPAAALLAVLAAGLVVAVGPDPAVVVQAAARANTSATASVVPASREHRARRLATMPTKAARVVSLAGGGAVATATSARRWRRSRRGPGCG